MFDIVYFCRGMRSAIECFEKSLEDCKDRPEMAFISQDLSDQMQSYKTLVADSYCSSFQGRYKKNTIK